MNDNQNKEGLNHEKIKAQISNLESFLLKTEYLEKKVFNKKHLDILNQASSKQDYLFHFEFNEKISFSEASVKYGILIQSIKNNLIQINQLKKCMINI